MIFFLQFIYSRNFDILCTKFGLQSWHKWAHEQIGQIHTNRQTNIETHSLLSYYLNTAQTNLCKVLFKSNSLFCCHQPFRVSCFVSHAAQKPFTFSASFRQKQRRKLIESERSLLLLLLALLLRFSSTLANLSKGPQKK